MKLLADVNALDTKTANISVSNFHVSVFKVFPTFCLLKSHSVFLIIENGMPISLEDKPTKK